MSKIQILSAIAVTASLWMGGAANAASTSSPQPAPAANDNLLAQFTTMSGLTVTGTGLATAPADVGIMYLNYYSNYYPEPSADPNEPPAPPAPASAADMKPVVDALVAAGVSAGNVEAIADPNSLGSFRVRVKVDKPTQAKVQALVAAANGAISKNNKFSIGGTQIAYATNNCASLENEARKLAVADARSRATAIASVAGVSLGSITALIESSAYGYYGGPACPSASDPTLFTDPYSFPAVDPLSPAVVRLNSNVTLTYEMK